ncbi:MAG: hypothetical protein CFH34_00523 [Alphaproteobacteria bacterium MarineAlpha9_Bin4]|nr:succinate dehydrogenase, cytochrome b556 subunit [Pelagibacterales bacterium]PPR27056.1 MAG: hypothetical protein CFH34_00523 [Alphaproteobacteria bacterium MarineAlpha9_Bin4]
MKNKNRPLSPHLSIYKPQITSILSISHRISGVFQSLGLLIIIILLLSLLLGENYHKYYMSFIESYLGKLFIFFYIFSLSYHMFNGIRHILWDLGFGFEMKNVYYSGYTIIFLTLILGTFLLIN